MKKTIRIALMLAATLGGSTVGHAIQHIGDAQSAFRSLDEAMPGMPTLLDWMRLQDLMQWSRDLTFQETFAGQWERAGCTVEDRSEPLARVICPGFRTNPKLANEDGTPQWLIEDLMPPAPAKEPKRVKPTLPEGQI